MDILKLLFCAGLIIYGCAGEIKSAPTPVLIDPNLLPKAWKQTAPDGTDQGGVNLIVEKAAQATYRYYFINKRPSTAYIVLCTPFIEILGPTPQKACIVYGKTESGFLLNIFDTNNGQGVDFSHQVLVMGIGD